MAKRSKSKERQAPKTRAFSTGKIVLAVAVGAGLVLLFLPRTAAAAELPPGGGGGGSGGGLPGGLPPQVIPPEGLLAPEFQRQLAAPPDTLAAEQPLATANPAVMADSTPTGGAVPVTPFIPPAGQALGRRIDPFRNRRR
jgi:hypothetical protein